MSSLCLGCDLNAELYRVIPCGCLLCPSCYTECVEENDLECVHPDCTSEANYMAHYRPQAIIRECLRRGYPLGDRDLVVSLIGELELHRFKKLVRNKDPRLRRYWDMTPEENKEETIYKLHSVGIVF